MNEHSISGRKVTIVGAARSGVAAAELLHARGASVFVTDSGPADRLAPAVEKLRAAGIQAETGGHSGRALDADFIVVSPGVPATAQILHTAAERRIPVYSELEAASWFCPAPVVAVTGTNGKTTTTSLIGRMIGDMHRPHVVAGNIGTAFSAVVRDIQPSATVVLEVSSFQLERIESFHPAIAILLNITPDHLDRYDGVMEKYIDAKCRIFERQGKGDTFIYNFDDPLARSVVSRVPAGVTTLAYGIEKRFDEGAYVDNGSLVTSVAGGRTEIIQTSAISIPGIHNLGNAMAATLAAMSAGIMPASIRATLRNFKGVEHRLEFVRTLGGVSYVNDSKATNVDSVWYALQSFQAPIVLFLGGRDKGNDYSRLNELVRRHVKHIVAIGESAPKVVAAFSGIVPVTTGDSMEKAVAIAKSTAVSGDIVLLSPACASFDWYDNYEHRGRVFKSIVNAL